MQAPSRSAELLGMGGVSAVGSLRSASRTSSAASLAAARRSRSPSPMSPYAFRNSAPPSGRAMTPSLLPSSGNGAPCLGASGAGTPPSSSPGPELQCPKPRWPAAFAALSLSSGPGWMAAANNSMSGSSGVSMNNGEEPCMTEQEAPVTSGGGRLGCRSSAGLARSAFSAGRPGYSMGNGSSTTCILQRSCSAQALHSTTPPPAGVASSSALSSSPTIAPALHAEWRVWYPTYRIEECTESTVDLTFAHSCSIKRANSYAAPSPCPHGVAIPSPLSSVFAPTPMISSGYGTPTKVGECGVSPPVRAANPQCRDARFCLP
ncbi:hypothetical protein F1559_004321 [Cyanidiococcus yangmingshanensis]|uniref:Uncharacterized protein n=1 Tax=Cyanidiococcus yangmingshanensis TaxID=2690220 RepID=A0A7J7IL82_9RHOD|nr:hypothetical protein F1559_004321 [Cyanidiococcus yangmingshanensis]